MSFSLNLGFRRFEEADSAQIVHDERGAGQGQSDPERRRHFMYAVRHGERARAHEHLRLSHYLPDAQPLQNRDHVNSTAKQSAHS